jgi:hypothetical protein
VRQRNAGDQAQDEAAGDDDEQPRHGGRGGAVAGRGDRRHGVDGGRADALHEQVGVALAGRVEGATAGREIAVSQLRRERGERWTGRRGGNRPIVDEYRDLGARFAGQVRSVAPVQATRFDEERQADAVRRGNRRDGRAIRRVAGVDHLIGFDRADVGDAQEAAAGRPARRIRGGAHDDAAVEADHGQDVGREHRRDALDLDAEGVQLVAGDRVGAEGALLLVRLEDDPDGGAARDQAGAQQRVALAIALRGGQLPLRRRQVAGDAALDDGARLEHHHHRDRAQHADHRGEGDHHDADHEARSRGRRASRRSSREPLAQPCCQGHAIGQSALIARSTVRICAGLRSAAQLRRRR